MKDEEQKKKRKAGRPEVKLDVEMIEKLATIHCTPKEMGYIMGVDHRTIMKHHGDLVERGRANGKLAIRRKQIEVALSGDKTLLIWLGKVLLGQSETQLHDEDSKVLPWTDDN